MRKMLFVLFFFCACTATAQKKINAMLPTRVEYIEFKESAGEPGTFYFAIGLQTTNYFEKAIRVGHGYVAVCMRNTGEMLFETAGFVSTLKPRASHTIATNENYIPGDPVHERFKKLKPEDVIPIWTSINIVFDDNTMYRWNARVNGF